MKNLTGWKHLISVLIMITQYLQRILGYHVEFKVCLVSKPIICQTLANPEKSVFFCIFFNNV